MILGYRDLPGLIDLEGFFKINLFLIVMYTCFSPPLCNTYSRVGMHEARGKYGVSLISTPCFETRIYY